MDCAPKIHNRKVLGTPSTEVVNIFEGIITDLLHSSTSFLRRRRREEEEGSDDCTDLAAEVNGV